jgi:hypothetical protein
LGRIGSVVVPRGLAKLGREPRTAGVLVLPESREAGSELRAIGALPSKGRSGRTTLPRPSPERLGIATLRSPRDEADAGTAMSPPRRIPLRVGTLTCERSGAAGNEGRTTANCEPLLTSCSRRIPARVVVSRTVAVGTWPRFALATRSRPTPLLMIVLLFPTT